jgi:hypothetical protein
MRATSKTLNPFFWLLPLLLVWALLAGQSFGLKTASGQNSGLETTSTGFVLRQAAAPSLVRPIHMEPPNLHA